LEIKMTKPNPLALTAGRTRSDHRRSAGRWAIAPLALALAAAAATPLAAAPPAGPDAVSLSDLAGVKLPASAKVVGGRTGLPWASRGLSATPDLKSSQERSRDVSAVDVYPRVAPAVVVVSLPGGHGTGFVVDVGDGGAGGWLLTNNHVAVDAVPDPVTGAQAVDLLFGRMDADGWMRIIDRPVRATVNKLDPVRDLALLHLVDLPGTLAAVGGGRLGLPAIPLARAQPRPGSDCIAIGHPGRSGSLWSVRSGQVTGLVTWPDQDIDNVLEMLSASTSDTDRATIGRQMRLSPKRRVLYSDVGINLGDSGGPLVDPTGALIGVTFAMPSEDPVRHTRQGTTSYHVALDEVRSFIEDRPADPIMVTDPWSPAPFAALVNLTGGDAPDVLEFGPARDADCTALLFDLRHDSDTAAMAVADLSDPAQRHGWKYAFAITKGPCFRTFYDTAGSGHIDLVLAGPTAAGPATVALRLTDGRWTAEPVHGRALLDPDYFTDPAMRQAFVRDIRALARQGHGGPSEKNSR
jgi:S1-C subfamily serine protease